MIKTRLHLMPGSGRLATATLLILVIGVTNLLVAGELSYPIVDTNQTHVYDLSTAIEFPNAGETFFGQDGQYSSNQPNYKDNGDGTVSDLVTGLMWTQDPLRITYSEAVKGAKKCKLGGYSDWRLPSIKELYSLIQFNGLDPDPRGTDTSNLTPFMEPSVFTFKYGDPDKGERIIDIQFATTAINVSPVMNGQKGMFGVNMADGRIKCYGIESRRGEKIFSVIYVRGNPEYGKNKFKDNGDGTVTDLATGLMWMKADSVKGMDWPTALEYAENLELAGYSDWRLPNAKELQSILDYSRSPEATGTAAIDPVFDATEIKNEGGNKDFGTYWTSTTHLKSRGIQSSAVYFAFGRSLGWMPDRRSGQMQLLDVHGAGSQRADPKVGDASRYPQGHGPQGDVVRIDNLVRPVRGGNVSLKAQGPEIIFANQPTPSMQPGPGERQGGQGRQRGPGGAGGQRPQGPPSPEEFMGRFDANKDGKVTRDEFDGPQNRFDRLDQNKDGMIIVDEFPQRPAGALQGPNARQGQGQRPVRQFQASGEKPNFVFILADDMGWTGTSVKVDPEIPESASDYYQTPNLEKFASEGMTFTQAYSPGPMCTPSRAAILTGKTPAELHMTAPGGGQTQPWQTVSTPTIIRELPTDETTIGEMLKAVGYSTAYFGKWHQGRVSPGEHGFDEHDGPIGNEGPENPVGPKDVFGLNERAMAFIEAQVENKKPFYVQLSHWAVHGPFESSEDSEKKFAAMDKGKIHTDPIYAGMTYDFDVSIGILLEKLDELKLRDNTYVIFMSDNGAPAGPRTGPSNTPLRAGKSTLYEGGIRVPLIARGPGIEPGSKSEVLVSGCDIYPTLAQLAGIRGINEVDGQSLVGLLRGGQRFNRRNALLFHFPHYGRAETAHPQTAIFEGDFKLVKDLATGDIELFNLQKDIGEANDLSKRMPEKAIEMVKLMDQRLNQVSAQLMLPNEAFDSKAEFVAAAPRPGAAGRGGGRGAQTPEAFMERFDANKDGKVTREEFTGPPNRWARVDPDGDGIVRIEDIPEPAQAQ
ncbi:MAG: sulfatase-like hydrolase/transferase [Puniceicoccaceae bacterium]